MSGDEAFYAFARDFFYLEKAKVKMMSLHTRQDIDKQLSRYRVAGGWLYRATTEAGAVSICFVPDGG